MIDRPQNMSSLVLGCYPLGGGYGGVTEEQARGTVDAALDAGWSFFDTAEAYLDSEERLGRILAGRRDRVFLATKVLPCETFTYEHLDAAVDGSLRRLGTDHIDLFQLHAPENWFFDIGVESTPLEEIADALARLRASGKVRYTGVCNFGRDALEQLSRDGGIFSTQNLYNMVDRGGDDEVHMPVEDELIPLARERGMAFLAYQPFVRGLLVDGIDPDRTFAPDDERHFLPRFQPGVYEHYVALAGRLSAWAQDHGRSLLHLAVAWTLHHPDVTACLIGAKSARNIAAVAGAEEWVLSEDEMREVDAIVATLPPAARAASATAFEHLTSEQMAAVRERRYADARPAV
jgi:aryl-alcohol dehydrogenase-like predicted oxidoreductase